MYYNALGRCVNRTLGAPGTCPLSPTTFYIYDGEKPILEYNGANVARNLYGKGIDEILMRSDPTVNGGAAFYFDQNHEGSVTLLTDTSGNVLERYRYDVFGAPTIYAPNWISRSATLYDNRFLFTGREYAATYRSTYTTAAFNFYEYRARAYNAKLGRFMSEDPKLFDAGDYNLFRYCHNDPIDNVDPMGLADERREPWYNHEEQAKQLANLQNLLNQKLLLGYGAISLGGLQYAVTQLQQTMGDTTNFHMAQVTKQGADTKTFGSWQDAGRAGATQALALAAADPNHREWNFDIGQSESDAKA